MLDDERAINAIDEFEMRKLLASFPQQIADAWALDVPTFDFRLSTFRLIICGMGGSAIGGDLLKVYLHRILQVFVVRDYELPPFADENSLVFAVSYSGNTEETISAFKRALERRCKIIVLASGGELLALAAKHGVPVIELPKGLPPRTALGYLFMPLLKTVCKLASSQVSKFTSQDINEEVEEVVSVLKKLSAIYAKASEQENSAKQLARLWHQKIPITYGSQQLTDVIAYRWKTQINENAKAPAFASTLPELNHNETVGWENRELQKFFVYNFLRDKDEHKRIAKRFELCKEILEGAGCTVRQWAGEGEGLLARLLSLIYLGDWASFYLAVLYGVDPTPVKIINHLKKEMGCEPLL